MPSRERDLNFGADGHLVDTTGAGWRHVSLFFFC